MKYQIIGGILLLVIGFGLGKYTQPAKVITKTQVVTNDVVHDHIHTVVHTVVQPNGEKDTTTVVDNNSTEESSSQSSSSTVTTYNKPQWKAQVLAGLPLNGQPLAPIYGAGVERRIIGPISAGVWGNNNREAGLSVSLEF